MKSADKIALIMTLIAGIAFGEEEPPDQENVDDVVAAFSNFVVLVKSADTNGIQSMIQGTKVVISATPRSGDAEYGTDINLPFLANGFQSEIQSIRLQDGVVARIRTVSTCVWFQRGRDGEWKITRYLDKPIE